MVLETKREGALLRLTLDRPDKRNALSPELVRAVREAIGEAAHDETVRAVLIEGRGRAFCAGGDFDAMLARRGNALATKHAQDTLFAALARDILHLEKPVVAHVNGDAFGAGMMLALASDYAVAAPTARFAATFVKVGLVPDTAGTWLLPRTCGLRTARELVLLAETLDASRAKELRIINEIHGDAGKRAEEVAHKLAAGPTRALGLAKKALVLGGGDDLEACLAREASYQALCFTTEDHAEGVDAFREKREAHYAGK